MAPLSRFAFAASTLLVASVASAADECSSSVSETIIATIDNRRGRDLQVSTLFDVLNFTDSEFLLFCNSSTCLGPVHEMIHSIPSDCLILYEGTERNLSEEVTALHDDDDMSMSMSMSGMNMDGTTSSTTGSSAASTVSSTFSQLQLPAAPPSLLCFRSATDKLKLNTSIALVTQRSLD
ncbi:Elicitin [Phytophthora cactorum]|nr:Elicitin [Phytophthora cactorum]